VKTTQKLLTIQFMNDNCLVGFPNDIIGLTNSILQFLFYFSSCDATLETSGSLS